MDEDLSLFEPIPDLDVNELMSMFSNVENGSKPQQIHGDNGPMARPIGPMQQHTNEMFSTIHPAPNPNIMVRPNTAKTFDEVRFGAKGPPQKNPPPPRRTSSKAHRVPQKAPRNSSSKAHRVPQKAPRNSSVVPRKRPPNEIEKNSTKEHLKPKSKRRYVEGPTCPSGFRPWRGGRWLMDDPVYGDKYEDMCIVRRRPPPSLFINKQYVAFAK